MEKSTDMISPLIAEKRDWDFAIVYMGNKPPVMIAKDVKLEQLPDGVIKMKSKTYHPNPQTPEEQSMLFTMHSFFQPSSVIAVDYYIGSRIQSPSGLHIAGK